MRSRMLAMTLMALACGLPALGHASVMPPEPPPQGDPNLVTDPSGFIGVRGMNDDPDRANRRPVAGQSVPGCPTCAVPAGTAAPRREAPAR